MNVTKDKAVRSKISYFRYSTALAGLLSFGNNALAQTAVSNEQAAEPNGTVGIEEIIVTAQKKSENVQKVGIAIQAFTGDDLAERGIQSSTQLVDVTPGLALSSAGGGTESHFSIRGVTQSDYNDIVESPNAVYLDDGYMPFQGAQTFMMMDLERVEIQKGPQGTLFGRNATGGLIQFISRKPSLTEYSGYLSLEAGMLDSPTNPLRTTVEGAVGGPISDKLGFRIAAKGFKLSPFVINRYPEQLFEGPLSGDGADLGAERMLAVRGILLFKPSESFSSELTGFVLRRTMSAGLFEQEQAAPVIDRNGTWVDTVVIGPNETRLSIGPGGADAGWDVENIGIFTPGPPGRPVPGGDYFGFTGIKPWVTSSSYGFDKAGHVDMEGVNLKNTWDISGAITLTSVSDYKKLSKLQTSNGASGPTAVIFPTIGNEAWSFTQELRLNGKAGNLQWQAGAFYLHTDIDANSALGIGLANPQISLSTLASQKTNSYSIFAQGDWSFADKWKLILGGRYTQEKKRSLVTQTIFLRPTELYYPRTITDPGYIATIGPLPGGLPFAGRSDDGLWAMKAQINYSPTNDMLLYAGVNRGVKAGGFNSPLAGGLPIPASLLSYKPEVIWAFEGGVKSSWFDNRLQANLSIFHYDYRDYQAFLFAGVGGIVLNRDSKTNGGELSIKAVPARGLNITAGVSYTDAKVFNFPTDVTLQVVNTVRPSFTPKWRSNLDVRYSHSFHNGTLTWDANWTYRSSMFFSLRNFSAVSDVGHSKFGAGISWEDHSEQLNFGLRVENLTNERIKTSVFDVASVCGCVDVSYELPRVYTLSVRYNF